MVRAPNPNEPAMAFPVSATAPRWRTPLVIILGGCVIGLITAGPRSAAGQFLMPLSLEHGWGRDVFSLAIAIQNIVWGLGQPVAGAIADRFGVTPDLVTFAKGVTSGYVPLGGVMVGDRIAKVLIEQGGEFEHGYTYSGHPVACAVAVANIRLIQQLGLVERVRNETGPHLAKLYETLKNHPLVGEAETCGLMGALQLVKNKHSGELFPSELQVGMVCRGHCFGNGLIMRAVGDRMIVAPPLAMTRDQIDELGRLIVLCLDKTWADVKEKGWA